MQYQNFSNNQKGFTLVELAIVMIIIGLLIGGVLKGQELINNAKITAVISEVKGYQAAMLSFRGTYGGMPGDLRNAEARLPGCGGGNAAGGWCQGGDGNGLVGVPMLSFMALESSINTVLNENGQFWKHLALADIITGVNPGANSVDFGETFPASSLRGGYNFVFSICGSTGIPGRAACDASPPGHILRLIATSTGGEGPIGGSAVSSFQASILDRKLDDGIPFSGWVRSVGNGAPDQCEQEYTTSKSADCTMHFKIDG